MNEKSQPRYLVWVGIAAATLLGIGLISLAILFIFEPDVIDPGSNEASQAPTPSPIPVVTISGIKSLAEVATIEYSTVAEIRKETLPEGIIDEFFNTKEQLLMLVYGEVKAGFDLQKLGDGDLWADGTRVKLVLPAPEILNSSIDFDRTHTVYYDNNLLFSQSNPDLQQEALAEAKKAIEKSALEAGILNQANDFGKLYFENFLYSLGFTDVEVVVDAQIFSD